MAGLLVSVRSAEEARAAVDGGASVVDVKEPDRGPLGRACPAVWREVRAAVPAPIPVSVALGELVEWEDGRGGPPIPPSTFAGLTYRKLGLAGSGTGWADSWADLRRAWGPGPGWVAVAYADWKTARAPDPDAVLETALEADCVGILVDTHDKRRPSPVDPSWASWVKRAQSRGLLVTLAGGLDAETIARLAPLAPDLFAVRGAACAGADRRAAVDAGRVALLVRAARGGPDRTH